MNVLLTGMAGFIGFHLARRLAERGDTVAGVDNLNAYYDVELKHARLAELGIRAPEHGGEAESSRYDGLRFLRRDIGEAEAMASLLADHRFDYVCHLAAQAGVRYSLDAPFEYVDANMRGFLSLLEAARGAPPKHFLYASTSSVYGLNRKLPFSPHDGADRPVSLYAASKKANEAMAHAYGHLFDLPTTGLRFFTVYGPWGRPDMAPIKFARAITRGETIDVYNNGEMRRDFTFVSDIVEGILAVLENPPARTGPDSNAVDDPSTSPAPYRILNIGRGEPVELMDFIRALERELGTEAKKRFLPMQPGDMVATWADTSGIEAFGYRPTVSVDEGVRRFVQWYREYESAATATAGPEPRSD
jgi:UDP-glucuronate 4-epimerase